MCVAAPVAPGADGGLAEPPPACGGRGGEERAGGRGRAGLQSGEPRECLTENRNADKRGNTVMASINVHVFHIHMRSVLAAEGEQASKAVSQEIP
jgi:hypothetical protein